MKKSSSPSSSSSSSVHSTIHPSIVIGIVVITIFVISDIGTYSYSGSSLCVHCCTAQVYRTRLFTVILCRVEIAQDNRARLPRITGLAQPGSPAQDHRVRQSKPDSPRLTGVANHADL